MKISELTPISLRELWKHEAHDFSVNIYLLEFMQEELKYTGLADAAFLTYC